MTTQDHPRTAGLALLSLLLVAAQAGPARADSYDMIAAGVGTSVGVSHVEPYLGEAASAFSTDLTLRARALYIIGLELGVSPTDSKPANGLVFQNILRLSGLLFVVPTRWVSVYAKGGIEGDSIAALFSVEDPSNAYHVGCGVDVAIGSNFVVNLEWLVLIPGIESIRRLAEEVVARETARYQTAALAGTYPDGLPEIPDAGDFVSASNFRLTAGVRYYF